MSVCTFNMYNLYWFYKNWGAINARATKKVSPTLRATFQLIYCYACFKRMDLEALNYDIDTHLESGALAIAYILLNMAWWLPDPIGLIGFLSFLPLLRVNRLALAVNDKASPECPLNDKFSTANWAWMTFGIILLALSIGADFIPFDQLTNQYGLILK